MQAIFCGNVAATTHVYIYISFLESAIIVITISSTRTKNTDIFFLRLIYVRRTQKNNIPDVLERSLLERRATHNIRGRGHGTEKMQFFLLFYIFFFSFIDVGPIGHRWINKNTTATISLTK